MPRYVFRNNETDEEQVEYISMSALDDYVKNNPHLTQEVTSPLIVSGRGMGKPDDSFRDLLREIKKGNSKGLTKSSINTF